MENSKLNDLLWFLASKENLLDSYYSKDEEGRRQLRDFFWFMAYRDELSKKYHGKNAVIRDREIIGVYDSFAEAVDAMEKQKQKPGTYIIQPCVDDEDEEDAICRSAIAEWRDRHIG